MKQLVDVRKNIKKFVVFSSTDQEKLDFAKKLFEYEAGELLSEGHALRKVLHLFYTFVTGNKTDNRLMIEKYSKLSVKFKPKN